MRCDEARAQLETRAGEVEAGGALGRHLEACEACRDVARERRLVGLLATLPVPEPFPGFEDRVLRRALARGRGRSAVASLHTRWALATAASVVVAVLVTFQFYPAGNERGGVTDLRTAVVEVPPQQTRTVTVRLTSPRALEDALITVELDENLALEGYRDVTRLQWRTALQRGANQLALPVRLLQGRSGNLTVTVEHGGSHKRFSVRVDAAPGNGDQTLSMI